MKIKKYLLLTSLLFCSSCETLQTDYQKVCYQCYYGNEIELNLGYNYSLSDNKVLLQNEIESHQEEEYYFEYHAIYDEDDLNSFYSLEALTISDTDKEALSLSEDMSEIVFFCQIPKGYKAYKRDNIQYRINDNEEIFLTDNFYFYRTINDVAFCYFDVKQDETISENYVYSFVIKIHNNFNLYNPGRKIRGIISDRAYNS